jgi:hypothetical protein
MLFLLTYLAARNLALTLAGTTVAMGAIFPGKTYTSGTWDKPTTSLSCPDWNSRPPV